MATVNNVVMPNYPKGSGNRAIWPLIWAATRAAKKAGWKTLASSDGSTKTVSDDPGLDEWGAGAITNGGASAASTGALAGGRMTVTGLTGIVAKDKGRFLVLSGASSAGNNHHHQIEEIVSGTEVRVDARRTAFTPVASDASNGSIVWEVRDPTTETRDASLDSANGWILMEGPSTIKVPITSFPAAGSTTNFIVGENVVQATTSAEGEILGFVFDSDNSIGYCVILPRVFGSGGDPFGWGTGEVLTGDTSGATVTQVGTAVEYVQRVMWKKVTNQNDGNMYVQCIDPVGESVDDFLTLASASGCTASVGPGQGGTDNAFPTIAFTSIGNAGSTSADEWGGSSSANTVFGNVGQAIAADAIWESGHSADGTFYLLASIVETNANINVPGNYQARGVFRMDDIEPGELDPFITFGVSTGSILYTTTNRTTANETTSTARFVDNTATSTQDGATTLINWRGWQGRGGLGLRDTYSDFENVVLYGVQTDLIMVEGNPSGADSIVSEPVYTRAREPVRIAALTADRKCRKGSVRHLQALGGAGGASNTLYEGGKFLQLHSDLGSYVGGPWDETSVPRGV